MEISSRRSLNEGNAIGKILFHFWEASSMPWREWKMENKGKEREKKCLEVLGKKESLQKNDTSLGQVAISIEFCNDGKITKGIGSTCPTKP